MDRAALAATIDHTLLRADASREELLDLCRTAVEQGFHSVCVNSGAVDMCRGFLGDSPVVLAATVGFPLGAASVDCKVFEARCAIAQGAGEIDYVVDLGAVKSGRWDRAEEEMARMTAACHQMGAGCKVIFENCYLTEEEKARLCGIARRVRPDFVKTSTGFGTPRDGRPAGATVEDVAMMKRLVGEGIEVKAAGGIRTTGQALAMLKAGATRLGASSGVAIVQGFAPEA